MKKHLILLTFLASFQFISPNVVTANTSTGEPSFNSKERLFQDINFTLFYYRLI